jgi:hypothetical protein
MFGLFGREKKANEKHEQELKERLANKLISYNPANDNELSEFVNVDFDEGCTATTMIEFSKDAWTEWAKENRSEIGVFNEQYKMKA